MENRRRQVGSVAQGPAELTQAASLQNPRSESLLYGLSEQTQQAISSVHSGEEQKEERKDGVHPVRSVTTTKGMVKRSPEVPGRAWLLSSALTRDSDSILGRLPSLSNTRDCWPGRMLRALNEGTRVTPAQCLKKLQATPVPLHLSTPQPMWSGPFIHLASYSVSR